MEVRRLPAWQRPAEAVEPVLQERAVKATPLEQASVEELLPEDERQAPPQPRSYPTPWLKKAVEAYRDSATERAVAPLEAPLVQVLLR